MSEKEPIVVVGAGYVGLVTAAWLAQKGHEVWCVDIDEARISDLRKGRVPISEPGLTEVLTAHKPRLRYVTDQRDAIRISGADLLFVAVGTPSKEGGPPEEEGTVDLANLICVLDRLLDTPGVGVVVKSTVPPGIGEQMIARYSTASDRLPYVSCPEFLQEGAAMRGVWQPDRVVIGARAGCRVADRVAALHQGFPVVRTDITTAETIKQASNLHLALRITFANQVANFCEHIGADGTRVLRVVGLDHRIGGEFLEPSVGFGGSCLSKDARALRAAAKQVGYDLSLATEILETNESQADRVVEKLAHRLGGLDGTTIALLGLAFKANTDDVRDSPAFRIAARLRARSAVVRGWDPSESARRHAVDERAGDRMTQGEVADEPLEALRGADACVVVTDWRDIKDIDWESAARIMRGRFVLDGRNILEPARIQRTGLVYEGTGRMSRGLLRA